MKKIYISLLIAGWIGAVHAQVEYVDPSMGGQGFLLEPTRPTVSLPNSMVRVYPVRHDQLDDQIHSFPLTIISHRLGELFWLMPSDGSTGAWDHPAAYDQEVETPYYYSARFDSSLIRTEFTPTARCGYFRFTFSSGKPVVLLANRIVFPTFPAEDFTNLPSFADKLKQPTDALSIYLKSKLSDNTLAALTNYQGVTSDPDQLRSPLADDFNKLAGSPTIYDAQRFTNIVLRPETEALLARNPKGDDLRLLNRLLLEDAYPTNISRVHKPEGELFDNGDNSVSGFENIFSQGSVTPGLMHAYVYGEFSEPVKIKKTSANNGKRLAITAQDGQKILEFRYGISFISIDQAKKNLQEEIPAWNFDKIKLSAKDRWNEVLGQIKVEGGTPEQKRVFYTSLYRCYERMVNITEDGQYYSAFDHQVHQDVRPFYVDNWLWDTYRALEPLQTLLNPEMEADKLQSFVRMYEESGWMPTFAVLWGNHECMTGNPIAPWTADAWNKGITNFDIATAYAGIKKNSVEGTWLPWRRGPRSSLDDFFAEHGYMPALHVGEKETIAAVHPRERRQAVSVTEAQSYDDWCTAQIARSLGNDSDYQFFLKRAADYKNVFRVDKGHAWPKDADGNWIEPFDSGWSGGQGGRDYTTENNGYTYDWDVQHDLQGLFGLMGGRAKAEDKLDQLFREGIGRSKFEFWAKFPDASGLVGQFSMGNEPSLHIPYIYNYLGAPWKTQKRVRMLLDTWFTDTTLGMPGDEDGGGMSAFVVFSMMGFYPVTAGVPIYDLCSPVFDRVTIKLHNGKTLKIICRNNSKDNKYIQSIRLNGKPLNQVWFTHADIANGGTLELQMGNTPNEKLGADPSTFPPSAMSVDPRTF